MNMGNAFYYADIMMRKGVCKKYWLVFVGLFLIFLGLFVQGFTLKMTDSTIYDIHNNVTQHGYTNFWSNGQETYRYSLDLHVRTTTDRLLQIYPNDCVASLIINNIAYKFPDTANLCDTRFGVTIDVSDYLQKGYNNMTVEIKQQGKGNSFVLKPSSDDAVRKLSIVLILFGMFLCLIYAYKLFIVGLSTLHKYALLFLVGVAYIIGSWYIVGIDYFQWTHDLVGHLDHIRVALRGDRLPRASLCRECYHPPLFYWLSALMHKIASLFGWIDPMEFARLITYGLFHIGILYGVIFLVGVFYRRQSILFWLSVLLFLFRPTNFIYGGRVMNDVGFYTFSFAIIYYSYRLLQDPTSRRYLLCTLVVFALGLLTKSNTIIWLPLVFIPFLNAYFNFNSFGEYWKKFKKQYRFLFIGLLSVVALIALVNVLKDNNGVVGNADRLTNELSVEHVPLDYTFSHFDYSKFIHNTSTYTFNDSGERGLFRNFLAKTMLTGEMDVTQQKNVIIFPYMHILFLILTFSALYSFGKSKKYTLYLAAGFLCPIIAMMLFRIQYPFGSSMHYRYIYPHLLFFIYFAIISLDELDMRNPTVLQALYIVSIIGFIILSLVFSFPPYF